MTALSGPAGPSASADVSELPDNERRIFAAVRRTGRLLTRIKERSEGDEEFIQPPLDGSTIDGEDLWSAISEADVIPCLHALEARGLLTSVVSVNAASTTEYICEWKLR